MADDECKLAGRRPKRNPESRTLESPAFKDFIETVSYTHLRAHET